jgi:hypothetical protein
MVSWRLAISLVAPETMLNGAARSLDLALQNHAHNKSIDLCSGAPEGQRIYLATVDLPFSFKLERLRRYEVLRGLSLVTTLYVYPVCGVELVGKARDGAAGAGGL